MVCKQTTTGQRDANFSLICNDVGSAAAPDLAIGDGTLGFWNALREVFGVTKKQRCWFHKTGLAMACKLMMSAQTKWRKLDGANRMLEIIQGIEFKDEIKQLQKAA